ncbi:dTDP-4-dehydrorhamnose 3,5-epimerase [Vreelandella malpeensis]|uniref:dTDP-4-dehydrorhamnose 3,5-epimerase n=1 Tax=Vreelandella malpeensis TaxID=1172368 RepID=A0ABS8DT83_9GAMM|nr:dTDP-4-dehydrorhamnose 3,5-epimerase [Halomonas malpeensis]MCB8889541.1 dTDP-4-dehydrorhamnose 3,5-epimerase [Halomonas malpeensis]
MQCEKLAIPDVMLLKPKKFEDERGFFMESFNQKVFEEATGIKRTFVQDNHSRSVKGVLRGLHYQEKKPQGKLVRVVSGEILDVAVDIRKESPTFGKWVSEILSSDNYRQLWIPEGFAHGFLVLSKIAEVVYKTTEYYSPSQERAIKWNDPGLSIDWRVENLDGAPMLSEKDSNAEYMNVLK